MRDERVILSESPEDLKKAVEWGREQQKKMLNDKGERMVEAVSKEHLCSFETAFFICI